LTTLDETFPNFLLGPNLKNKITQIFIATFHNCSTQPAKDILIKISFPDIEHISSLWVWEVILFIFLTHTHTQQQSSVKVDAGKDIRSALLEELWHNETNIQYPPFGMKINSTK
jgi:hypothetical protein